MAFAASGFGCTPPLWSCDQMSSAILAVHHTTENQIPAPAVATIKTESSAHTSVELHTLDMALNAAIESSVIGGGNGWFGCLCRGVSSFSCDSFDCAIVRFSGDVADSLSLFVSSTGFRHAARCTPLARITATILTIANIT